VHGPRPPSPQPSPSSRGRGTAPLPGSDFASSGSDFDFLAVDVGREWLPDLERITAPGLVLWGESDPSAASPFGARLAERTRARFASFPGCSHWWQLERPAETAAELEKLWASAERTA